MEVPRSEIPVIETPVLPDFSDQVPVPSGVLEVVPEMTTMTTMTTSTAPHLQFGLRRQLTRTSTEQRPAEPEHPSDTAEASEISETQTIDGLDQSLARSASSSVLTPAGSGSEAGSEAVIPPVKNPAVVEGSSASYREGLVGGKNRLRSPVTYGSGSHALGSAVSVHHPLERSHNSVRSPEIATYRNREEVATPSSSPSGLELSEAKSASERGSTCVASLSESSNQNWSGEETMFPCLAALALATGLAFVFASPQFELEDETRGLKQNSRSQDT